MDATCCPADIAYPQDIELLNGVREQLECVIDQVCDGYGLKKPRTYRKRARKDYLNLVKRKRRGTQVIRKAIRKQLQYIRRDVRYIVEYVQSGIVLTQAQKDCMNLMTTVYEQQHLMFETGTHSIPRRIVSLPQPWVRPIVQGKAHANTEFGVNSTSVWLTATFGSSAWISNPIMRLRTSTAQWKDIGRAMDGIPHESWPTNYIETARH